MLTEHTQFLIDYANRNGLYVAFALIAQATNAVKSNIHARRDFVTQSQAHGIAFAFAADQLGYTTEFFDLRRKSDGNCPDDESVEYDRKERERTLAQWSEKDWK